MSDTNQAISTTVVDAIKHHHREAMGHATQAIDHAKQAGELLLKAKATIPHGGWLSWLSENCAVSPRQAQRYIEAAQGKKVPIRELIENDAVSHVLEEQDDGPELARAKQWCEEAAAADQDAVVVLRSFEQKLAVDTLAIEEAEAIVRGCELIEKGLRSRKEEAKRRIAELNRGSKYDTASHLPEFKTLPLSSIRTDTMDHWPTPEWQPEDGHWYFATWDDAAFWVVPSLEHPAHFHVSKLYKLKTPEPSTAEPEWDGESQFDGTKRPMKAYAIESMLQHFGMAEPAKVDWDVKKKAGLSRPFGEPEVPHIQEMP